jgi:transposase-like protein
MKSNKKAGPAGRRERRAFSAEFKAEAVRLVAERRVLGATLTQIGRELDVRPEQLRGCIASRCTGSPPGAGRQSPERARA